MALDLDSPFQLDSASLHEGTGEILLRLANLYRRRVDAGLRALGLTHAQEHLLYVLAAVRPGRERRVSELAEAARLHPVLVTRLLGRFERRGLVERLTDPSDARASRIRLTKAGRELRQQTSRRDRAGTRDFFAPLKGERPAFERLVRSLLRANDPDHEGAPSTLARRADVLRRRNGAL